MTPRPANDARRRLRWRRAGLAARALSSILFARLGRDWAGSPPHLWLIAGPAPKGLAAAPAERRPADPRRGEAIMAGRFPFDGRVLEVGPGGDPWNRPSPSRGFAEALHRMDWLPDLTGTEDGARTALSLALGWHLAFGRWNGFSWSPPILERRTHNLACAARPLLAQATPAEARMLLGALARHARALLLGFGHDREAERCAAASLAAVVLAGGVGNRLLGRALERLDEALTAAVPPSGGHASRSPERALELLLDLQSLEDGLAQRGWTMRPAMAVAVERLGAAVRHLTLADGRLAALQGGEAGDPARVAAAWGGERPARRARPEARGGYERLAGRQLEAIVDAAAPAQGPWSLTACAQPLAIEVTIAGQRVITSSGWSPRAQGVQALRLTPAASTATVSDSSCGAPLQGWAARALGRRLEGAPTDVRARRHDGQAASWLELGHDGWAERFGLLQERRLYLDAAADELRGEDRLSPALVAASPRLRRPPFLAVRFHLAPDVKASLALDERSVLLQLPGHRRGDGWWLRNDAPDVRLQPATLLVKGRAIPTVQVLMRAPVGRDGLARIRWKLGQADR